MRIRRTSIMVLTVVGVALAGPASGQVADTCEDAQASIVGTDGPDTLEGTAAQDIVQAAGGDDVVAGLGGGDVLCGGEGSDRVDGGGFSDRVFGEAGDDELHGGEDDDLLFGGAGDDTLLGGAGDDALVGGPGNDVHDGGSGDDRLGATTPPSTQDGADAYVGGPGRDALTDYARRGGAVVVTLNGVADDGGSGEGDDVAADVEVITTGSGADAIVGGDGHEELSGRFGDDVLTGGFGSDVLRGDSGNDRLRARDGVRDIVDCGSGSSDAAVIDLQDRTVIGCESVSSAPLGEGPTVRIGRRAERRGRWLAVRLACPAVLESGCEGELRLLAGPEGRGLGARGYRVPPGGRRTVRVRLRHHAGRAARRLRAIAEEPGVIGPRTTIQLLRVRG